MNECQICDPLQMLEDVRVQRDAHHRELLRLRAQLAAHRRTQLGIPSASPSSSSASFSSSSSSSSASSSSSSSLLTTELDLSASDVTISEMAAARLRELEAKVAAADAREKGI
jgi:hypothetical protein